MYKALLHDGWSWTNMLNDCQEQCKACPDCQRWTIGQHGYHPVAVISAELPFDHVAIDLAGPFTPSPDAGHVYLLVMVDVCTRFVFLRLLQDKSMVAVARQLVQIFCDVGFPKIVQSDNGKEFVNELMRHVCTESHIDHRLITPYHPRANGLAERFVQTAKSAIFKLLKGREQDWALYVPQVQLFINTKVAALHGSTPYSLMFGRKHNSFSDHSHVELDKMTHVDLDARLLALTQLVYPAMKVAKAINTAAKSLPTGHQEAGEKRHDTFSPGTYVMAKDELRTAKAQPRYLGPFLVIRRNRGGAYILQDAAGNALKRAPEALKQVTINREFGDSANVERVMDHRGHRHEREYLVKWQGLDSSHNSWVKVKDFDNQAGIQNYWKKQNCANPRA
jgi:transposase InsO family protein